MIKAGLERLSQGLAMELQDDGFALEHVDLGGGLGIAYEGRPIINPADYASAVIPELRRIGLPVVLEPGRAVVGHSGVDARPWSTKSWPDVPLRAGGGRLPTWRVRRAGPLPNADNTRLDS